MLARRAPTRSTTAPPKSAATASGIVAEKAASPVRAALPVVTRTNQGMASEATTVPASETASETMSA